MKHTIEILEEERQALLLALALLAKERPGWEPFLRVIAGDKLNGETIFEWFLEGPPLARPKQFENVASCAELHHASRPESSPAPPAKLCECDLSDVARLAEWFQDPPGWSCRNCGGFVYRSRQFPRSLEAERESRVREDHEKGEG